MTLKDNYELRGTREGMDLLYAYYGREIYFSYGETIPQNVDQTDILWNTGIQKSSGEIIMLEHHFANLNVRYLCGDIKQSSRGKNRYKR